MSEHPSSRFPHTARLPDQAELLRVRRTMTATHPGIARLSDAEVWRLYLASLSRAPDASAAGGRNASPVRQGSTPPAPPPGPPAPRPASPATGSHAQPSQTVPPGLDKTPATVSPERTWMEIELFAEDGVPVAGERYVVEIPGGLAISGRLDAEGFARIEGLDPGQCRVRFPDLDQAACRLRESVPEAKTARA